MRFCETAAGAKSLTWKKLPMLSLLPGDFMSQRRFVEFCDRLAVQAVIDSIILSVRLLPRSCNVYPALFLDSLTPPSHIAF